MALALPGDGARHGSRLFQRGKADVVGICERSLFPGHGAHAHAAIDGERPRFDDALLETPALQPGVLEVEIGVIDPMNVNTGKHVRQIAELQRGGREQQLRRLFEQTWVDCRKREVGHGESSAKSCPSLSHKSGRPLWACNDALPQIRCRHPRILAELCAGARDRDFTGLEHVA